MLSWEASYEDWIVPSLCYAPLPFRTELGALSKIGRSLSGGSVFSTDIILGTLTISFLSEIRPWYILRGLRGHIARKKCLDISSNCCVAHPVGCNIPLKIKMLLWHTFVWIWTCWVECGCPLKNVMFVWWLASKYKKKFTKSPLQSAEGSHIRPDHPPGENLFFKKPKISPQGTGRRL